MRTSLSKLNLKDIIGKMIGKKFGPPPKSGPTAQGLNINYNTVKQVKLEKTKHGNRQRITQRGNKRNRTSIS